MNKKERGESPCPGAGGVKERLGLWNSGEGLWPSGGCWCFQEARRWLSSGGAGRWGGGTPRVLPAGTAYGQRPAGTPAPSCCPPAQRGSRCRCQGWVPSTQQGCGAEGWCPLQPPHPRASSTSLLEDLLPEELPSHPHQGEGSSPPQTRQRPAHPPPAPFLSDGHCVHQVSPNILGEGPP